MLLMLLYSTPIYARSKAIFRRMTRSANQVRRLARIFTYEAMVAGMLFCAR